jgi:hypothetical protein
MTDRELMQQALDALEYLPEMSGIEEAIQALRDRLAQPEPEPVAWIAKDRSSIEVSIMSAEYMMAQGFEPLYTAPPKREWVGLTDEEIEDIWGEPIGCMFSGHYKGIKAIEAKLKEKNT